MAKISTRRALSEQEIAFCIGLAADLPQVEAWRRAFPGQVTGDSKKDGRTASDLAKKPWIDSYVCQLRGDVTDLARSTFLDQLLVDGKNPSNLIGAAKEILKDEQLQAERDDLERFWAVTAACGAEVVAEVGGQEVVIPIGELLPKFKDATPPQSVLDKTAKSLEAWAEKLAEKERELEERDRKG